MEGLLSMGPTPWGISLAYRSSSTAQCVQQDANVNKVFLDCRLGPTLFCLVVQQKKVNLQSSYFSATTTNPSVTLCHLNLTLPMVLNIWHSGFVPNLDHVWSTQNVKCFALKWFLCLTWCFYWKINHLYAVFCTPKIAVLHAFINVIFCQTGVKSHHPMGIKTSDGGNFFFGLGYMKSKNCS